MNSDVPAAPKAGALAVCEKCANVSAFGPGFELRKATLDELAVLSPGQRQAIAKIQYAIHHFRRECN
jgi:hypothetical protein